MWRFLNLRKEILKDLKQRGNIWQKGRNEKEHGYRVISKFDSSWTQHVR